MNAYSFDHTLPALPLPELSDTCASLKRMIRPLTGDDGFTVSSGLLDEFSAQGGDGERLHSLLSAWKDGLHGNASWLRQVWDDNYLSYRDKLPVNMNYCFELSDGWYEDALPRLIYGLARVLSELHSLPPEATKNGYLSMDTLGRTVYTRVPGEIRDTLYSPPASYPQTAAVVCAGRWFILPLTGEDGAPLSPSAIGTALRYIRERADVSQRPAAPVGAMTAVKRRDTLALRNQLAENPLNRLSLESIENSLFAVCLDDDTPDVGNKRLICGDCANRWFDKSLQIISAPGKKLGVNIEHSGCDAAIWVYLLSQAVEFSNCVDGTDTGEVKARELEWNIGGNLHAKLEEARAEFAEASDSLSFCAKNIAASSKARVKSLNSSPDAFAQLLFGAAYYKLTGKIRSVYEAVSTRSFYQGRTECMRPMTTEAAIFYHSLASGGTGKAELAAMFRSAESAHVREIRRAQAGLGALRHMAGLRAMYNMYAGTPRLESGKLPPIFEDAGFSAVCCDTLSTSSVTAPFIDYFGFGPVVPDGLGIGYGTAEDSLRLMVSAYSDSGIEPDAFIDAVDETAVELFGLLSI